MTRRTKVGNYYIWSHDFGIYGTGEIFLSTWQLDDLTEWDLFEGKRITNWNGQNAAYYEKQGVPYDLLSATMPIFVISERLKAALQSINVAGVQYLPIRILKEGGGGVKLNDYFVLNVDHQTSCLDLRKSEFVLWGDEGEGRRPDELRDLRKPVLVGSKIGKEKIFRLAEWNVTVVVEEQIMRTIADRHFSGSKFTPIEIS